MSDAICRKCRENGCFKCRAMEGTDVCAFHEDGLACPEEQRRLRETSKSAVAAESAAPASAPNPTTAAPAESSAAKGRPMPKKDSVSQLCPCGTRLRKDSPGLAVGACGKCFAKNNRDLATAGTTRKAPKSDRKPRKAANGNGHTADPIEARVEAGVATLCFTETQLVRMFTALPIEEKTICFQRYLEAE